MVEECSKRAEKRSRKQREAIAAAIMEERANAPLRISDKDSNSPLDESPNTDGLADSTEGPKEKKRRGPSKLTLHYKGKQKCNEVDFNARNQPVGPESVKLSSLEGILARELVPINSKTWLAVPEDVKDKLWACVKLKYKIHDFHRKLIMQKFGKLWRSYKSELSRRVRNHVGAGNLERVIALTKPDNVGMDEWKAFVKSRTSKAFIEKSDRFRKMRAKQTVLHTMSRKGYARLEEDMKNDQLLQKNDSLQHEEQSETPTSISRVDVWIKGHTRKNGKPVNEVLNEAVRKVQEHHKPSTEKG